MPRSLSEWLAWQESLNPTEIELGLDRVAAVAGRLGLRPPPGAVFVVAGTNGKGSTAAILTELLSTSGYTVGLYSSPHLVTYNERVRVADDFATDAELVDAFERVDAARQEAPLTFFEFGTLAALQVFTSRQCDAWVLEVGLGGRLDAVNIVDGDYTLITTVDIDHQEWLGSTVEEIAAEKAGILRAGKPCFYGDRPVPAAIEARASELQAPLTYPDAGYALSVGQQSWDWYGTAASLTALPLPVDSSEQQLRNFGQAFAVLEQFDLSLLQQERVARLVQEFGLPGRFQVVERRRQWVFDVAHNVQAARGLHAKLQRQDSRFTTCVVGMLADKQAGEFVAELKDDISHWVCCPTGGARGDDGEHLQQVIAEHSTAPAEQVSSLDGALERAREVTPEGGRVLVCGSFMVVGPALRWLGLY